MKTLVVGLGNPILGDDGVGWKVAEEVRQRLLALFENGGREMKVDVECLSLGGISLMERLIGYPRAILVDSFALDEPIGSILMLKLDDLPNYSAYHTTNPHDTSLQNAIAMGKALGAKLPDDVMVVGIATKRIHEFCEELSPPVAEAVPLAAKFVLELLEEKVLAEK
jgi:hydrogenase maturation protease